MELDYEITEIDIYKSNKDQLLLLAQKYKLKLPVHESLVTVQILRKALALTKDVFRRAQIDQEFLQTLAQVFFNNELPRDLGKKFPTLVEYKELLEHFYDTPENISFVSGSEDFSSTQNQHLQTANSDPNQTTDNLKGNNLQTVQLESAKKTACKIREVRENIDALKAQLESEGATNVTNSLVFKTDTGKECLYENDLINPDHGKLLSNRKLFDSTTQDSSLESITSVNEINTKDRLLNKGFKIQTTPLPEIPNVHLGLNKGQPQKIPYYEEPIVGREMAEEIKILIKPIVFSGSSYEHVTEFLYRFQMAADANFWGIETRKRLFPCYLTSYALQWFTDFIATNPNADFETLKREIQTAFSSENYTEELKFSLESRVQGQDESPIQFLYTIKDLSRKAYPNITEQEMIAYVTKGLRPKYFNALMYLESPNMEAFQTNLRKLESKFLMQKVNAKKHNLEVPQTEHVHLMNDVQAETARNTKSVQFSEPIIGPSGQFLNMLTDISQKLENLKFEKPDHTPVTTELAAGRHHSPSSYDRPNSNSFNRTSRRDSFEQSRYNKQSPSRIYDKNRYNSRSPNRSSDRTNFYRRDGSNTSSDRVNSRHFKYSGGTMKPQSSNYGNNYRGNRSNSRHYDRNQYQDDKRDQTNFDYNARPIQVRQNTYQTDMKFCAICNRNNHALTECFYNSKSRNFKPQFAENKPLQSYRYSNEPPSTPRGTHYFSQVQKNFRRGN